jgi:dynein heavy chain
MDGWPQVVSEDIVKQVHKLKNEMFVMGGKIKGKTLLPIPEHLGSLDGTLESMQRWVDTTRLPIIGWTGKFLNSDHS